MEVVGLDAVAGLKNGTGGRPTGPKPFITTDTIPCRSSGNIKGLEAERDVVAGGSPLDSFLVSLSTPTLNPRWGGQFSNPPAENLFYKDMKILLININYFH